MTIRSRAIFTFLVIFACIGCDQETKSIARQEIPASKPITKMGQMLQLQYTENSGALLGVGSGLPAPVRFWLFIVFAGAALTAILAFTLMDKKLRKPGIFRTFSGFGRRSQQPRRPSFQRGDRRRFHETHSRAGRNCHFQPGRRDDHCRIRTLPRFESTLVGSPGAQGEQLLKVERILDKLRLLHTESNRLLRY